MQFHHVGCAVDCIEDYLALYRDTLGFTKISDIFWITEQKVRVCFVEVGSDSYVELIEAVDDNSPIEKLKRQGYYHVCFLTSDLDQKLEELQSQGFLLITTFHSEAFQGRRCSFLVNPFGHLIELAEASPHF